MPTLVRRLAAEALGTFTLVFIGCAAVMVDSFPRGRFGLMGIAAAQGLALAVAVTATMRISGGHLNPAVTLGLVAGRRFALKDAIPYLAAQLAGAVLAVFLLQLVYPSAVGEVMAYGTPSLASTITLGTAIGIEAVLTFFLVSAVFGTVVSTDAPKVGGFGVGLILWAGVLVGGPLTGGALNPARAFGPALVAGDWTGHAVWWIGPLLGGLLAGLLWDRVLLRGESEA